MKRFSIERTDPVNGRIIRIDIEGKRKALPEIMPYGKCMDFVASNQEELKVYKIARTLHRRNGKRRFIKSIYASSQKEALLYFDDMDVSESDVTYQLLTGDWKIVAHFMVVKNVRGLTQLN